MVMMLMLMMLLMMMIMMVMRMTFLMYQYSINVCRGLQLCARCSQAMHPILWAVSHSMVSKALLRRDDGTHCSTQWFQMTMQYACTTSTPWYKMMWDMMWDTCIMYSKITWTRHYGVPGIQSKVTEWSLSANGRNDMVWTSVQASALHAHWGAWRYCSRCISAQLICFEQIQDKDMLLTC